ncbi:MAG: acyltransferase [Bacteroidetes bacterium]|nr:acyltransferase [Bacteroidota bacterium]
MTVIFNNFRGVISTTYLGINTLFWVSPLFIVTFFRLIIPFKKWGMFCGRIAVLIAENWVYFNNIGLLVTRNMEFELEGIEELDRKGSYLVISNHQSWIDIPVLQKVFYHKIPFLKFFLKKELIWVPFLGQAWWALDFPFMKRYSPSFLKKNPHLKGKDFEITKKACEKFKDMPVSVMNFIEGTRFRNEKHKRQKSPYKNLLRPKAHGISLVLSTMGDQLDYILDVTISYPYGTQEIWSFLCGDVNKVRVKVQKIPISGDILCNYSEDREDRIRFQKWLNGLWEKKDEYLEGLKT